MAKRRAVAVVVAFFLARGAAAAPANAFFYQLVEPGANRVHAGTTTDGLVVRSSTRDVVRWAQTATSLQPYGDPVFSRLPDGRWAMTSWSGHDDPRGAGVLLYHESTCPQVDDSAVIALGPSHDRACVNALTLLGGKTSQVFGADGGNWVFLMNGGEIWLAHLADPGRPATTLGALCLRPDQPSRLADVAPGEVVRVIGRTAAGGLLLSDSAIVQRANGTWVLYVKGIAQGACTGPGLCELCTRAIYRATSTNLLTWSALERVVTGVSLPEATIGADGRVWLYFMDFADACAANDLVRAARAPISAMVEDAAGMLSARAAVSFPDEAFETSSSLHYATNGNPVNLPDAAAQQALDACFAR